MKVWNSFLIAFSMYSRIPVPKADWKKENMRYVMCFFPLVGAVTGLLTILALWLCRKLFIGQTLTAVLLVLLPVLVSGGIHMDGLMDTMDALSSWQPKEKKLEILKDSRSGAFAVLSCGGYLLMSFGLNSEVLKCLDETEGRGGWLCSFAVLAFGFVVSRALSGLSVVSFPCARDSGLAAGFSEAAVKRTVKLAMAFYLVLSAAGMLVMNTAPAICMWAAVLLCFWYYYRMSMREFGGITGDLAGFFLQLGELAMTAGWLIGMRL